MWCRSWRRRAASGRAARKKLPRLVARMAEENLAGPTAKRDPRTVELVQLDEEPWAMAVGEVNVFRMNQNSGGIDDEYDLLKCTTKLCTAR